MQRRISKPAGITAAIIVALAFVLAVLAVTDSEREVFLDYDSGVMRESISVHGKVLYDTLLPSSFGDLVLTNGRKGVTGSPDWRSAMRFTPAYSRRCPQTEAGRVYSDMFGLGMSFCQMKTNEAQTVKMTYLDLLRMKGRVAAGDWVSKVDDRLSGGSPIR